MKAFRPGRELLRGVLLSALAMSCTPKPSEKTVGPVASDTPAVDTAKRSDIIAKVAATEGDVPLIPLNEDEDKIAMDHWTDGNLYQPMLIVFSRERLISFLPYIPKNEFDRQDGDWSLRGDTLTIVLENDTASYKIIDLEGKAMDMTMISGHKSFFGQNHGILYRDNEKESYQGADFIGSWAAGDGFKFTDLKNFAYYDPLCSEDFPGTWSVEGDVLYLKYTLGTCNDKGYQTRYSIVNLSDHWMILHDEEKADDLAWYRERVE